MVNTKISTNQIINLQGYIQSLIGCNIYSNSMGNTVIDLLYTNEIKNEYGLPIKSIVTDAINSIHAQTDINHLNINDYIYNIEQILYHPDQLRITHGNDIANKELGKIITINYVQNAENDHYNQAIHKYIKDINQLEPNSFTINTGEQQFNNVNGKTITINKVNEAINTYNDQFGNNIANSYATINHQHNVVDIKNLKQYIEDNIIQIINKLLNEGKIKINNANTIQYNQYPKYDFNNDETIVIELPKNNKFNRPAPEILKLKTENTHWSSFIHQFNINNYFRGNKYINDNGQLINNKSILFGPPRQLNNGYISYSGVITSNNIKKITNLNIQ